MVGLPALFTWVFVFSFVIALSESQSLNLTVSQESIPEMSKASLLCEIGHHSDGTVVDFIHTWQGQTIRSFRITSIGNLSNHTLTSVSLQDAGNYRCKVGQEESNILYLPLKAAPRLASSPSAVRYADAGQTVTLSAIFYHVSDITHASWTRQGEPFLNGMQRPTEISHSMYGKVVNISATEVSVTWSVNSTDFMLYDVTVCTKGGCSSEIIELKHLAPPLPPTDLRVVDNKTDGFWFRWRSGINNGGKQMFELDYKRSDTKDDWYTKTVKENTGSEIIVHAQISGLLVDTGYDVRVLAFDFHDRNKRSNYTDELQVYIKGPVPVIDLGLGAGIGIGMSIMVLVGALVGLVIFLVARKKHRSRGRSERGNSCSSEDHFSNKTQLSNMSTRSNPYQGTSEKETPPDLPPLPTSPRPSRTALPRPPIPGGNRVTSNGPPHTSAPPISPIPKNTRLKNGGHPPLPLPLQTDEVYEPVEGEESGQEYVDPRMAYENM